MFSSKKIIIKSENEEQNELPKQKKSILDFDDEKQFFDTSHCNKKVTLDIIKSEVLDDPVSKEKRSSPIATNKILKFETKSGVLDHSQKSSAQNRNIKCNVLDKPEEKNQSFIDKTQVSEHKTTVLKYGIPDNINKNVDSEKFIPVCSAALMNYSNLQEYKDIIQSFSSRNGKLLVNNISLKPSIHVKAEMIDHAKKITAEKIKPCNVVKWDEFLKETSQKSARNEEGTFSNILFPGTLNKNSEAKKKKKYLNSAHKYTSKAIVNKNDISKAITFEKNKFAKFKTNIDMHNIVIKIDLHKHTRNITLQNENSKHTVSSLQEKRNLDYNNKELNLLTIKKIIGKKDNALIAKEKNDSVTIRKKVKTEILDSGECTLIPKNRCVISDLKKGRFIFENSKCSVTKTCNISQGKKENLISKEKATNIKDKNEVSKEGKGEKSGPYMAQESSGSKTIVGRVKSEKVSPGEGTFSLKKMPEIANEQKKDCFILKKDTCSAMKTSKISQKSGEENSKKNAINIKNENEVYKKDKRDKFPNITSESIYSNVVLNTRKTENVVPREGAFILKKLPEISGGKRKKIGYESLNTQTSSAIKGNKGENLISKKSATATKCENEVCNRKEEKSVSNKEIVEVSKETSGNLIYKNEGKIIESYEEEKSDIENPGWQKVKNLNTNEERYKQVRSCWQSKTVPNPNKNLTHQSFRNHRLKIGKYYSRQIKQHKRLASNSLDDHKAKRFCNYSCTYYIDKKISLLETELFSKTKYLIREMNNYTSELEQQCMLEEEVVRNTFLFCGYDDYTKSYARISQIYNIHIMFTQKISELQNEYRFQIAQSEAQYRSKINALKKVREEIFKFYKFYKGLDDSGDTTLVTEAQLKELDEIENIYARFQSYYG